MPSSKALQRQEYIIDILEKDGDVSAKNLAKSLNVSIWTIRRDLNALEQRGVLTRYYGGAGWTDGRDSACRLGERRSFRISAVENKDAKRRIGLAAAHLLHTGERLALAGGTTTLEVAKALKGVHFNGDVVTNALA